MIARKMMKQTMMAAVLAGASIFSATGAWAQAAGPPQRVLVIPFSALNVPDSQQWISKGVMESLVADLGRTPGYAPVAFQGQIVVEDNATAVRLARQASSTLVIRGAAQMVGENVRLTAQVIDVKSGDTVNTASVTGASGDLLKLEDDLSAQLRGVPPATAPNATASAPGSQPGAIGYGGGGQAPQIIVIAPPAQQSYPGYDSYPSYASYPYASYPYPYDYYGYNGFYPGLITGFIFTPGRHDHDHDHFHHPDRDPVVVHNPRGGGGIPNNVLTGGLMPNIPGNLLQPNIPGNLLRPNIPGNALLPNIHMPPSPPIRMPAPAGFSPSPAPQMQGGRTSFVSQRAH